VSAQTVHLSSADIKTVSKQIAMSFLLIHVTKEYNQVRPKQFLSLWYLGVEINTISKWTEMSFHSTHVT
jgi:hypothetical protein